MLDAGAAFVIKDYEDSKLWKALEELEELNEKHWFLQREKKTEKPTSLQSDSNLEVDCISLIKILLESYYYIVILKYPFRIGNDN